MLLCIVVVKGVRMGDAFCDCVLSKVLTKHGWVYQYKSGLADCQFGS